MTNKARRLRFELPVGNHPAAVRRRVELLERLLERSFTIPGTRVPVGLDGIVGLVPGVGDVVTATMGAYIVWEGRNLGLSRWQLWRMGGNLAIDTAIGAVPFVGDAFDLVFRSHSRNLAILRRHLDRHHPESRIVEG